MRKGTWIALAAAAVLLSGLWAMRAAREIAPFPPPTQAAHAAAPANTPEPAFTLFPGLSGAHITSLSVATPERSFQFQLDPQGAVSVNGQLADSEVFSTLLAQIASLPVQQQSAFAPQSQDLILTLVISTGAQQQTAHFYEHDGAQETARIVLDAGKSPEYRQTGIWRVGTLMMTCEGTRILDAHGNETPVLQIQ